MVSVNITTFNKVTTSPSWSGCPLKPTGFSSSGTAQEVKAYIDGVLDNMANMVPGESIMIQVNIND